MDSRVTFQSQITRILDALVRAAVLEISELLVKEDTAELQLKLKRREEEIQNLLRRLHSTEEELLSIKSTVKPAASHTCSVSVQASAPGDASESGGGLLPENQFCMESHILDSDEHLEFEVKIEQVEEPKEEKCSTRATEQDIINSPDRTGPSSSDLWASPEPEAQHESHQDFGESDSSSGFEEHRKDFLAQAEQYAAAHMLIQDGSCSLPSMNMYSATPIKGGSHDGGALETKVPDLAQQSRKEPAATKQKPCKSPLSSKARGNHAHSPSEPPVVRQIPPGLKVHRCGECGKRFTQKNRLVSHQWVHTGVGAFHCSICGKTFSRQDNCQRHERLHSQQHNQ